MNDCLDISFTVKESELAGRRLLRDLKTGQIYYDPMEPVEPPPEASVEQPSADPAPPIVDLLSLREKQLDEAFKPLGAKIDAKVLLRPPSQLPNGRRCTWRVSPTFKSTGCSMTRMDRYLNWLDRVTDRQPLWVIYLILSALSMGLWYLAALGLESIARRHDVVPTAELKGLPVGRPQYQPDRAAIREQLIKQYYK